MIGIGIALKPASRHVDVDPLSGAVSSAHAPGRAAPADKAALETALRLRDAWEHVTITVACAVPAGRSDLAEPVLREALALGAHRAVQVETAPGTPGSATMIERTAAALGGALAGCDVILCGDYSADGGSGAVPALLAAAGDRAQALGLVAVEAASDPGTVLAERRLDRGRRERLRVRAPMVLSVEGAAAKPRRAALPAMLRARTMEIGTVSAPPAEPEVQPLTAPYRPRARVLPAPTGATPRERVLQLLGAAEQRLPPRRVDAEPASAAQEIVDQLRRWGYL